MFEDVCVRVFEIVLKGVEDVCVGGFLMMFVLEGFLRMCLL